MPNTSRRTGSSPHTRGTPPVPSYDVERLRFIPAYAGNAHRPDGSWCGAPGSSPHTRGTPAGANARDRLNRFIPAYAGNASDQLGQLTRDDGSSPHTRGTLAGAGLPHLGKRFIPAYAGNAAAAPQTSSRVAVHPRIRGERRVISDRVASRVGSSPHTRGTRAGSDESHPHGRFIPAYAGNAPLMPRSPTGATVHPRIRGERWPGYSR